MLKYVIIAFAVLWFVMALYWEKADYTRLNNRTPVNELDEDKQMKELKFYACFNSENNIMWRSLYISAVLSVLAISFVLDTYHPGLELSWKAYVGILFFVFLIFYVSHLYRTFHLYREMTSKVKTDLTIL